MRILVVGLGAALVLSAAAGPAFAKVDLRRVIVEGPGVPVPIVLGDGEDPWTFLLGGGDGPTPSAIKSPPATPGPSYTVTVVQGHGAAEVTMRLYPFAPGGPVLHVGDDQLLIALLEWSERPGRTGWIAVSKQQLEMLWARGFPRRSPVVRQTSPVPEGSPPVETTAAARVSGRPPLVAFVSLGILTLAAVVTIRHRFRRMAKPGG